MELEKYSNEITLLVRLYCLQKYGTENPTDEMLADLANAIVARKLEIKDI